MKKPVKIDALSKLRQFTKGMDVEDFLSTEYRQVQKALEKSYTKSSSEVVFMSYLSGTLSGAVSLATNHLAEGEVKSNFYFPAKAGQFWVEYNYSWSPEFNVVGSYSSTLVATDSNGAAFSQNSAHTYTGLGIARIDKVGTTNAFLTSLSERNGISFSAAPVQASLSNFNCKIFRIS